LTRLAVPRVDAWSLVILVSVAAGSATLVVGEIQAVQRETLRILAYNIHHGEGMDNRVDLERIAVLINNLRPDLVALQEVDRMVERTGFVDQAAELGELTGLTAIFGDFMPYQGGDYGMAVLSRWPIVAAQNHRLPDGEEPRSALAVRVRSPESGRELEFVSIHLYRTADERLAQAQRLADIYSATQIPVILAGDFNSTPDSDVIALLARSWQFIQKGADHLTFPSTGPIREIDFVAYSLGGRFEVVGQRLLDEPVASDHRPLFVELVLVPTSR